MFGFDDKLEILADAAKYDVVSNPLRSLLTMARRLTSLAVSRRFADCLQQATWLNSSAFVSSIQLRYFAKSPSH